MRGDCWGTWLLEKKVFQKLAGLWLVAKWVNHVGLYGSKVAEGCSAFQRRSCWVYDPAADPHIKLLIRAFRLERLVQRRIMPKRDLDFVLLALIRLPFASECDIQGETSNDVIPLKWRTIKIVFLLALASVRRRSYIHALSVSSSSCVFSRENTQSQLVVSLLPEPGFLAKNQLPSQAPEWISVSSIDHLNPSQVERMLCPVRQLKLYRWDSEWRGVSTSVHSLEW